MLLRVVCVQSAGLAGLSVVHHMLRAEQASLTGEPQAVLKGTDAVADVNCELQVGCV